MMTHEAQIIPFPVVARPTAQHQPDEERNFYEDPVFGLLRAESFSEAATLAKANCTYVLTQYWLDGQFVHEEKTRF